MKGKGLGRHQAVDMRDALYLMRPNLERLEGPLPDYKVWSHGQILDQGAQGACVGFGWTAWHNAKPRGYHRQQGNDYALGWYKRAQQLDEWPGEDYSGTSVRAGAKAGLERNLLTQFVWATGRAEIDAWLKAFGPVVIGTNWYRSMDTPDQEGRVAVDLGSGLRGGHCLCLIGVDQNGYYVAQQSWGADHGKDGIIRFWPDGIDKLIRYGGLEACDSKQTGVAR